MKREPADSQTTRSPNDGQPYYCDVCGAGLAEFMACEELNCRIESLEAAANRRERWLALQEQPHA